MDDISLRICDKGRAGLKRLLFLTPPPPPQEPVVTSGHICLFDEMQVKSVLLDDIMREPENPTEDLIIELDIKVSIDIL